MSRHGHVIDMRTCISVLVATGYKAVRDHLDESGKQKKTGITVPTSSCKPTALLVPFHQVSHHSYKTYN